MTVGLEHPGGSDCLHLTASLLVDWLKASLMLGTQLLNYSLDHTGLEVEKH